MLVGRRYSSTWLLLLLHQPEDRVTRWQHLLQMRDDSTVTDAGGGCSLNKMRFSAADHRPLTVMTVLETAYKILTTERPRQGRPVRVLHNA